MGLKDIGAKLPPGFRFHPSDEELVCHYLRNKIRAKFNHHDGDDDNNDHDHDHDGEANLKKGDDDTDLVEIDLHTCEPWQLPDVAKLNAKEWYFFSFRDRKYATGYRTNRATISGYWKATGKDRMVMDPRRKRMVGMRKTLVFYRNRAPNGIKTTWIMHEFRLECPNTPPKEDWVLCRVFNKYKESQLQEDNETRFVISSTPPKLNYAPNYTHLPSTNINHNDHHHHHHQIPCGWEQIMGPSSSTTSSNIDHHHHGHHHHIPCGWDKTIGSLSSCSSQCPQADESLLNLLYDNVVPTECCDNENNYKNMFSNMEMENNTCIGSSSDIHLENDGFRFEIDNTTLAFQ